jgi:hypothetical protein
MFFSEEKNQKTFVFFAAVGKRRSGSALAFVFFAAVGKRRPGSALA